MEFETEMKIISTKVENYTKNVSKATRNCILDVYVTYFCSLKCFLLKETGETLMIYLDRDCSALSYQLLANSLNFIFLSEKV